MVISETDPPLTGSYYATLSEVPGSEPKKEPLSEEVFRQVYQYDQRIKPRLVDKLKKQTKCSKDTLLNLFPITKWLPSYKKEDLVPDIISGLTVAVMHIPQGMAYALLGGVPPVVGIYMALFPVFIYIIMGTSPHISMGSFAVVCMMVGKSVHTHSDSGNLTNFEFNDADTEGKLTPLEVATTVCFAVGIWQVGLALLKLGSLSVFLSGTLVSGFTTGAAVHVFTSQIKSLLGLRIKEHEGPLKIVFTYVELFTHIDASNYVAVIMSACTITILAIHNELFKPFLQKKFKRNIPVPIELIIVVSGTLLSQHFELNSKHNVPIVKRVPTGLPVPAIPPLNLLPSVLVDGLIIGIVAITINISMANIFAKKLGYNIDGNQEILASGVGNIFGSFFSCMPYAVSLSRSLIQQTVGARTQITNIVSCSVLIIILLFVAPFFEPLPFCVLSSIIVVALKGMFLQFKDLIRIMKLSRLDGFVWLVTFIAVVILDIDYGLGIGLVASLGTMVFRSQEPKVSVLGRIPGTQIFKDMNLYKKAQPLENVLILEAIGGLHFANVESLRKKIFREILDFQTRTVVFVKDTGKTMRSVNLILSLSSVPYVDPSAVKCLENIYTDLSKKNSTLLLCDVVPSVYDAIQKCNFFEKFSASLVFPTVFHAVEYLEKLDVPGSSVRPIYQIS